MGFHPTDRDKPPLFEQQRAEIERLRNVLEKLKVLLPQGPIAAFKLVQDTLKQTHN